jgi:hypothetical protein
MTPIDMREDDTRGDCEYSSARTVLGGALAAPCTRNPLQRG